MKVDEVKLDGGSRKGGRDGGDRNRDGKHVNVSNPPDGDGGGEEIDHPDDKGRDDLDVPFAKVGV